MGDPLNRLTALRVKQTKKTITSGIWLIISFVGMCAGGVGVFVSFMLNGLMKGAVPSISTAITSLTKGDGFNIGFFGSTVLLIVSGIAFIVLLVLFILKLRDDAIIEAKVIEEVKKESN